MSYSRNAIWLFTSCLLNILDCTPGAISKEIAPLKGTYEMQIMPETVDLTNSATYAINAITRCTNPDACYRMYFFGNITTNPVRLVGHETDAACQWKLIEPLLLLRRMTGNRANLEVDEAWISSLRELPARIPNTHPVYVGRGLAAVSTLYSLTGDQQWRELGIAIVDKLEHFCGKYEDFAYFPVTTSFLVDPTNSVPLEKYHDAYPTGWPAMHDAWIVEGLVAFYNQSDYEPAIRLAGKLARHMRHHGDIFRNDGRFNAPHDGHAGPKTAYHFHRHTNVLIALLDYAIATDQADDKLFVQKGYEFARDQGNRKLGYFPEYLPGTFPDDRHGIVDCEGCCVADMTLLALNLSTSGVGDYWDDVDRYTRNMLTEMQLKNSEQICKNAERYAQLRLTGRVRTPFKLHSDLWVRSPGGAARMSFESVGPA